MSWLEKILEKSNIVTSRKASIPEGVWTKCTSCEQVLYHAELERNLEVCPKCNALIVMNGELHGIPLVACAFEFSFMGGSMGSVVGARFVRAVESAIERNCGLVCFSASGGARMQEALMSLMQMAKTSAALERLSNKGLPFISVMTDPTMGGVSASLAMLGDINIGEPKALIGFAGRRVIEQTVREDLPEGFQRSEFLLEHGAIDMIVDRREMRQRIAGLLAKMTNQKSPLVVSVNDAPQEEAYSVPEAKKKG